MMEVAEGQQTRTSHTIGAFLLVAPVEAPQRGVRRAAHVQDGLRGVEVQEPVQGLRDELGDVGGSGEVRVAPLARLGDAAHERLVKGRADAKGARGDALPGPVCHLAVDPLRVSDALVHAAVAEEEDPADPPLVCSFGLTPRQQSHRGLKAAEKVSTARCPHSEDVGPQGLLPCLREVAVLEDHLRLGGIGQEVQRVLLSQVLHQLHHGPLGKVQRLPGHGARTVQDAGHLQRRPGRCGLRTRAARLQLWRPEADKSTHGAPHAGQHACSARRHCDAHRLGLLARQSLGLRLSDRRS
mmetsp:Transcript_65451/g.206785  ORF Transcript_65451/g.206785 Transcript_65451/m.206785 type:complete len:297 (-) Transcript_65451:77-967(-)